MTYAAQVRSVSKSVLSQPIEDDFYDINSLRIICKYFVGSIVTVKTIDEVIEGVLHTISHNKICITLVTVAKVNSPQIITETASNKIINLHDVLLISTTNNCDKQQHQQIVTVKGKYFKIDCRKTIQKSIHKSIANGKLSNGASPTNEETIEIVQQQNPSTDNDEIKPTISIVENTPKPAEPIKVKLPAANKKTFSFNPNAPEFKPRSNSSSGGNSGNNSIVYPTDPIVANAGHMLFSPHTAQFPTVFSPNSTPAIFVPNIFFYQAPLSANAASASTGLDNCSFDTLSGNSNGVASNNDVNNCDSPQQKSTANINEIDEQHKMHPQFPQIVPMFPPMPIFVPNHSFKFNALPQQPLPPPQQQPQPFVAKAVEINKIDDDSKSSCDELSNPSNWPPLPLPVNQVVDNQK